MTPRTKSAVMWGLVGVLSFLVLGQGYALLVEPLASIPVLAAVALGVGVAAGALSYGLEPRVRRALVERNR